MLQMFFLFLCFFYPEIKKFKDPSYKKPREFRAAFRYLLPVLKIYSTRYVYHRFSVLAVNIEMQSRYETQNSKFKIQNDEFNMANRMTKFSLVQKFRISLPY